MNVDGRHVVAVLLTGTAFALLVAVSAVNLVSYRSAILRGALQDLEARAEVASRFLEEPLRTLDFARIRQFGEACRTRGYELTILSESGGHLFDTRTKAESERVQWLTVEALCGRNRVALSRPQTDVLAPFHRALWLFALAAVVGAFGMFVVFLLLYRQRVRIRELKRVEKFRRDFVADVSHEIKTPLTGILGAVEMLGGEAVEDAGGGERRRVLISLIRKESVRLNALVQSILDLARLEREGEVLNRVDTDIVELVRDLASRHGVRFEEMPRSRGVSEQENSPRSSSTFISIDPQLISQAVENLIVNAVRHSGTTDITASLSFDTNHVHIVVEDRGIGIPAEHASRIFDRFHRVDPARAAETGGAGLGLAIVRRIVRLHGGDVSYSPVAPHGSRFEIFIPLTTR